MAAALVGIAIYLQFSGDRLSEQTVTDQAREFIEENYYKDPTKAELEAGSIRGMIDELRRDYGDRFSHYFSSEEYKQFQQALGPEFSGVGLTIKEVKQGLEVTTVIPDSPAEGAKIVVGDTVVATDGESLRGVPSDIAIPKIKGEAGTEVELTILPAGGGAERDVTLERARISEPAASGEIVRTPDGTKVAHVLFNSFDEGAHGELRTEIDRLYAEGAKALVLDVRGNGGGRLEEARLASSIFVEDGPIVTTRGRADGEIIYEASGGALDPRPTIALVDGGSASATEILVGALDDYGLATIVGETTFGKGTVQNPVTLPDGGAINLTIAEYFTADGSSIADIGIPPDVRAVDDVETEPDEALDRSLEVLDSQAG